MYEKIRSQTSPKSSPELIRGLIISTNSGRDSNDRVPYEEPAIRPGIAPKSPPHAADRPIPSLSPIGDDGGWGMYVSPIPPSMAHGSTRFNASGLPPRLLVILFGFAIQSIRVTRQFNASLHPSHGMVARSTPASAPATGYRYCYTVPLLYSTVY